ncbi:hypothetical protein [Halomicrobium salinisoli]|uniref:hypothetical protein n=1 Tax=Halomicrobium salinisoli TaxID=2878391 RepID=UPI001CF007AF|nr:hypothetical protein [Halomicrobium salinisoli]
MLALRNRLALVLGLWTAATLGPAAAFAVVGPFDGAPTAAHAAVLAVLFTAGALVARLVVGRIRDPAMRLREGLELGGPMAVSAIPLLASFVVFFEVGIDTALALGVGGVVGFLAAFLVGYLADRVVIGRARSASERRVTFAASKRPPSGARLAVAGLGVAAAAVWGALALRHGSALDAFVPAMLGLSQLRPLFRGRVRRRYEITDRGLINRVGHLPWEKFDGFVVTDDALVLHGNVWPFGTVAFDRESVDDLDEVVAALDRHLPRGAGDHEDPSLLDNFRTVLGS